MKDPTDFTLREAFSVENSRPHKHGGFVLYCKLPDNIVTPHMTCLSSTDLGQPDRRVRMYWSSERSALEDYNKR